MPRSSGRDRWRAKRVPAPSQRPSFTFAPAVPREADEPQPTAWMVVGARVNYQGIRGATITVAPFQLRPRGAWQTCIDRVRGMIPAREVTQG